MSVLLFAELPKLAIILIFVLFLLKLATKSINLIIFAGMMFNGSAIAATFGIGIMLVLMIGFVSGFTTYTLADISMRKNFQIYLFLWLMFAVVTFYVFASGQATSCYFLLSSPILGPMNNSINMFREIDGMLRSLKF